MGFAPTAEPLSSPLAEGRGSAQLIGNLGFLWILERWEPRAAFQGCERAQGRKGRAAAYLAAEDPSLLPREELYPRTAAVNAQQAHSPQA